MLLAIVLILVLLWLFGGPVFAIGGSLIHLLLLIAVIVLIFDLFVYEGGRWRR
jgi:predicted neutral ceramidase superfamily lipid hydrolase